MTLWLEPDIGTGWIAWMGHLTPDCAEPSVLEQYDPCPLAACLAAIRAAMSKEVACGE